MRALLALLLLIPLAACGPARQPQATPAPAPTVPAVAELLAAATPGEIATVGYLYISPEGAILADSLTVSGGAPAPPDDRSVWVEAPPELPAEALTQAGAARYALVEARGTLEGPARFGPGGRYAFQLRAPTMEPLGVRELTIPLLLQNSGLYEGQAVRLRGELLATTDSALLVEKLGAGGVPEPTALQMKLAAPPRDQALLDRLRPAGSGNVRFGPVEITGLWRAGRLYPLSVSAP